jgi:hypothetical protein
MPSCFGFCFGVPLKAGDYLIFGMQLKKATRMASSMKIHFENGREEGPNNA